MPDQHVYHLVLISGAAIFTRVTQAQPLLNITIAPLILITLVENAFKHSVTIKHKWFVNILIEIDHTHLVIKIYNSVPDETLKNPSTGIGLVNIKERLKMLYDGNYELDIDVNQLTYSTTLKLTLSALSNE